MKNILKAHREFCKTISNHIRRNEWVEAMRKHLRADIARKYGVTEKQMDEIMNEVIDRQFAREHF